MMSKFDVTDENLKDMRNDLSSISQKVDAQAMSKKYLDLHINQLSTTVNPPQPGTTPSNTIQNQKNDGHFMVVTTRGGKKTIDTPMSCGVDIYTRKNTEVIEGSEKHKNVTEKDEVVTEKVVPLPSPPPPFPQILANKTDEGKYQRFITMLKQLFINIPLMEALEQMCGYANFMKDMVTNNISVSFVDDVKF